MPKAVVPAIAVDQLVKVYKTTPRGRRHLIRARAGSITGLLGGNGAGKTTTIAMIMGLVMPTSGTVKVLGAEMPRQRYQVLHRMNFESPYVDMPHRLTVRQNLKVFGTALRGGRSASSHRRARARSSTSCEFLDRPTGKLSAGQKTRVALAKALINSPAVLLLDEPTASLDPDTADWVRSHLERFRNATRRNRAARLPQHGRGRAPVRTRHHHEARPHRGRRYARSAFSSAMAARRSKRCFSTSRAGAAKRARPRNERSATRIALSPHRVGAMVLRYLYLLRSSWTRLVELIYWPAVQLFVWGFLQFYIAQNSGFFARASGVFIAAVLMWDVLFRGQLGFSVSFLEEMWSRNLSNLMISPLRPIEFVCALMTMSLIRLAIGMVPVTLLAIAFFGFNVYGLGLALAAFFLNLILTSWAVGIVVSGVLLRNGMGAESLAWTLMFVLMPLTCVYYPVSVLPDWLQVLAWTLPPTYVFEGMRALIMEHVFRADLMVEAFALNALYFAVAVVAFLQLLKSARRVGSLLQAGE